MQLVHTKPVLDAALQQSKGIEELDLWGPERVITHHCFQVQVEE